MSTAEVTSGDLRARHLWQVLERIGWPELFLIGLLVVVARRPEAVLAAEFTWEEASAFYVPTFFLHSFAQLAEPWGGTLQVVPRIGYLLLRAVPVYWAPLVENLLALATLLAVAAFIASDRLVRVLPDRRARIALAALVLVLPAQRDVMGALMNAQWYAGLWLAMLPMAAQPATARGRWAERVVIACVALTGPIAMLLAPVYAWRFVSQRDRHRAWLAGIVLVGGAIQLAMILGTGRGDLTDQRPIELAVAIFWLHAAVVPVIGERLSAALGSSGVPAPILAVGAVVLAASLVVTAWRSLPRAFGPILYGAIMIAASGLAVHGGANVWPPGAYERYFFVAGVLVAAIVVMGVLRGHRLAVGLAVLLGVGIVIDFRLDAAPRQGWTTTHACIGADEPCVVPIWPREYDVLWPGADGEYRIPDHVDP